jgi:catechol 2,3-dioxygenase
MLTSISERVSLSPETTLGAVSLTVSDLGRTRAFYEEVLGLSGTELGTGVPALSVPDGSTLVTLHADASAPARDPRAPGLFHLAIVMPHRRDLAESLLRLGAARWPLSGASDHLVSEALYLNDPDGNGVELYRDRPRDQWRRDPDGTPQMATLRLDLDDLLAESQAGAAPSPRVPAGTRIGHVHLQVSDIPRAEAFYVDALGFDPTVRVYPGALFVSAGGYHHHVGLNTWNSTGASAAAPGSVGLRSFEVLVSDPDELHRLGERLSAGAMPVEAADHSTADETALTVRDPFGTAVVLRSR